MDGLCNLTNIIQRTNTINWDLCMHFRQRHLSAVSNYRNHLCDYYWWFLERNKQQICFSERDIQCSFIYSETELMSQMNRCIEANFCSSSGSFSVTEILNICQLGGQYKCLSEYINTTERPWNTHLSEWSKFTSLYMKWFLQPPLHFFQHPSLCTDFLTLLSTMSTNLKHRDGGKGVKTPWPIFILFSPGQNCAYSSK